MTDWLAETVLEFVQKVGTYRLSPPSHVTDLSPAEMKKVLDKLAEAGRVVADNGAYRVRTGG